jgi:hypothetical protein
MRTLGSCKNCGWGVIRRKGFRRGGSYLFCGEPCKKFFSNARKKRWIKNNKKKRKKIYLEWLERKKHLDSIGASEDYRKKLRSRMSRARIVMANLGSLKPYWLDVVEMIGMATPAGEGRVEINLLIFGKVVMGRPLTDEDLHKDSSIHRRWERWKKKTVEGGLGKKIRALDDLRNSTAVSILLDRQLAIDCSNRALGIGIM